MVSLLIYVVLYHLYLLYRIIYQRSKSSHLIISYSLLTYFQLAFLDSMELTSIFSLHPILSHIYLYLFAYCTILYISYFSSLSDFKDWFQKQSLITSYFMFLPYSYIPTFLLKSTCVCNARQALEPPTPPRMIIGVRNTFFFKRRLKKIDASDLGFCSLIIL